MNIQISHLVQGIVRLDLDCYINTGVSERRRNEHFDFRLHLDWVYALLCTVDGNVLHNEEGNDAIIRTDIMAVKTGEKGGMQSHTQYECIASSLF